MVKTISKTWSNKDNHAFYDNMSLEEFVAGAIRSGLSHGEDIDQIKDFILKSESILEIGSGYGRVLKHILELGYTGDLEAIENDKQYYQFCLDRYGAKATIYNVDILEWKPEKKYDLVLLMWSSIIEYVHDEQACLFKLFSSVIKPGGHLIIEKKNPTPEDLDRVIIDGQNCKFTYNRPGGNLYFPSDNELLSYSDNLFNQIDIRPYTVANNIERKIYIFTRPCS